MKTPEADQRTEKAPTERPDDENAGLVLAFPPRKSANVPSPDPDPDGPAAA